MEASVVQEHLNLVWMLVAAAMVMLMQAGFTALESGLTQAKNTINVAIKNITDFIVAVLSFWAIGYGLMFGDTSSGWWGSNLFFLHTEDPSLYASFVFQATFAGTAATIVSGAVAERMKFMAYVAAAFVLTTFIYPISGHWIWHPEGWLAEMGMIDFAGSTVVHSLGGWVGLAGAWIIGPRLHRFNAQGQAQPIYGHSLVLAVVGVLILWFGWFGFNGGSTLTGDASIAPIIANTLLAAAAGGAACFVTSALLHERREVQVEKLLNGVVGGLVAITAGCAVVEPSGAVAIGFSAGLVTFAAEHVILHVLKIDDPINVVAAHGCGGAWGTLILVFFADPSQLVNQSLGDQFIVQLIGVASVFAWGFGLGCLLFWLLKQMNWLRVPPEDEERGLNVSEHGASSAVLDLQNAMHSIIQDGNLTRRVRVEIGSEYAPLAQVFNRFMDSYEMAIGKIQRSSNKMQNYAASIAQAGESLNQGVASQEVQTTQIAVAIAELSQTATEVAHTIRATSEGAHSAAQDAHTGEQEAERTLVHIQNLAAQIEQVTQVVQQVETDTQAISSILSTIDEVSEQTNLLALNAAIEAARAGEAGRGFAVVADEVRALSRKTRDNTQHIYQTIHTLRAKVGQSVQEVQASLEQANLSVLAVQQSGETFKRIATQVQAISSQSTQMAATAEQQSQIAHEVNLSTQAISEVAHTNVARLREVAERNQELQAMALRLADSVARFQVSPV
ncbi:ammonium transporter, Amt family [Allopseudospirillum japonicum]|uniref:Ammonium transporter n=2 Tax=Allopseudospirillum japonicum TaxID=64971 RepID=A0A1H6SQI8_9GAMM|nr:ammonium transporter, Amt family [Allopseudospirillum japonicum]